MWEIKLEINDGENYIFINVSKEPIRIDNYKIKIGDIIIEFDDYIEEIKKLR